jgi:hypothetical protein
MGLLKEAKGAVENPMGSKPTSPTRDPSRVGGADPKGRARGDSFHELREVDCLPVWAGAKADAEAIKERQASLYMVLVCRKRSCGLKDGGGSCPLNSGSFFVQIVLSPSFSLLCIF